MAHHPITITVKDISIFKELLSIANDLSKSHEYYTYVDCPKEKEEYDEYDAMMAPIWKKLNTFFEEHKSKGEE